MTKLQWPNYSRSLLNTTATILRHYGVGTPYAPLRELVPFFQARPRHVILMIYDGMGTAALRQHLDASSWLRRHQIAEITSVFPPTTTAAMTSYYTGLSPLEHGWLGWSLYFKQYGRSVDVFTNRDSLDKQPLSQGRPAQELLGYEPIYNKIDRATDGRVKTYSIGPQGLTLQPGVNHHIEVESLEDMAMELMHLCRMEESSFIFTYWPEPDATMHEVGPQANAVGGFLRQLDHFLETLVPKLSESFIMISADHGQIQVEQEMDLRQDHDLYASLLLPPSMEPRAASLRVKPEHRVPFAAAFRKKYGRDFRLLSKQQVLQRNLLGMGTPHPLVDDFLGDYLAIGRTQRLLVCSSNFSVERFPFLGHHAGLCPDEMNIPLIVAQGGQTA